MAQISLGGRTYCYSSLDGKRRSLGKAGSAAGLIGAVTSLSLQRDQWPALLLLVVSQAP